ncbi:hypothetical protein FJT64_011418 [Amphibalanus amphitrite]|uniref:Uncharacterized protein n=1 Tax=Amphibalanus amphitrite TaxID=1232801 RepID=A0A6A4VFN2_AMPAM|nr:hypothetical protein FJT64_011418 [Amphibalanus amphitrite]
MLKPSVNRWPTAIFFFIMGVAQVNASTIILLNRGRPNDVKKGARRSIIYAMGQQLVRPRLLERAARPVGLNSSALTALACVAREAALSEDSSGSGGVPSGSGGVPSGSGSVHSGSGGVPSGSGGVPSGSGGVPSGSGGVHSGSGGVPSGSGIVHSGVPSGSGSVHSGSGGVPSGSGSVHSGVPSGSGSVHSGVPSGSGSVHSGVPSGSGSVHSGVPSGSGSVHSGYGGGDSAATGSDQPTASSRGRCAICLDEMTGQGAFKSKKDKMPKKPPCDVCRKYVCERHSVILRKCMKCQ